MTSSNSSKKIRELAAQLREKEAAKKIAKDQRTEKYAKAYMGLQLLQRLYQGTP